MRACPLCEEDRLTTYGMASHLILEHGWGQLVGSQKWVRCVCGGFSVGGHGANVADELARHLELAHGSNLDFIKPALLLESLEKL